jgi:hypothetical protein
MLGFALPGTPPDPSPQVSRKLTVTGQIADGVTGLPLVGAYVEAEIVNASGYPQLANDPVAPAGAPKIVDQNVTGPGGWYTLDATYSGQGIQYPIRVNSVSADGTRVGSSAILVGQ